MKPPRDADAGHAAAAGADGGGIAGAGAGTCVDLDVDAEVTRQRFADFEHVLQTRGARAALAGLLALTDYRFIAIFRFQGGKATSVLFVDRENPDVQQVGEVPDTATYCCYVRDSRGVFTTADAVRDDRLAAHPAREAVLAYCGVPIIDPEGNMLGTLCHYDVVPRDPAQVDLMLMLQVAPALARGDHVPAYPYPPPAA